MKYIYAVYSFWVLFLFDVIESFPIELQFYFIFVSEDQKQETLTLTSFDWDGSKLLICATEDLSVGTEFNLFISTAGNITNVSGELDENKQCALFTLDNNPFTTVKETYTLAFKDTDDKLHLGTAEFAVNSTYMLYVLKYIK